MRASWPWACCTCSGAPLGDWAERYAGEKDPGIFVLDEVIGYLITVAWTAAPSPLAMAVAFFVFRFFDVVKPRLARRLESIPGGTVSSSTTSWPECTGWCW